MNVKNVKSLKNLNLNEMQRPNTMIIVHYKNKRLSIPLFQECRILTVFLNVQMKKFEETILKTKQIRNCDQMTNAAIKQGIIKQYRFYGDMDIVCYRVSTNDMNQILKLRTNIILSALRDHQQQQYQINELGSFDITSIFKYLELEPYYGRNIKKQPHWQQPFKQIQDYQQSPNTVYSYQIISMLHQSINKCILLGFRKIDATYICIKIMRRNNEWVKSKNHILRNKFKEEEDPNINLHLINQIQSIKTQNNLIKVVEYCPGGTLFQFLKNDGQRQLSQETCLNYLKQLLRAIYIVHKCYGVIHREITIHKIFVGLQGQLKINPYNSMRIHRKVRNQNRTRSDQLFDSDKFYYYYSQEEQMHTQIYSIGSETPPELRNNNGQYNSLVDYYNIGLVIYNLYYGRPYSSRNGIQNQENNQVSLGVVLNGLLSSNLNTRADMVAQLLSSLFEAEKQSKQRNVIAITSIQVGDLGWKQNNMKKIKYNNVSDLDKLSSLFFY